MGVNFVFCLLFVVWIAVIVVYSHLLLIHARTSIKDSCNRFSLDIKHKKRSFGIIANEITFYTRHQITQKLTTIGHGTAYFSDLAKIGFNLLLMSVLIFNVFCEVRCILVKGSNELKMKE